MQIPGYLEHQAALKLPSVAKWQRGKCERCGSTSHTKSDCPIPQKNDDRSAEQKAAVKKHRLARDAIRKARIDAFKKAGTYTGKQ